MKKRILSLLCVLALCLGLLPTTALAIDPADIPDGMTIIGTTVTKYTGSAEDLVIPEGVTEIKKDVFQFNTTLKTVTLPTTLETIGEMAFDGCSALTTVYGLENCNLKTISDAAFQSCTSLAGELILPSTLEYLGDHAFLNAQWTSVTFEEPSTLKEIGEGAFGYCTQLNSVTLPAGLVTIGEDAFISCTSLEQIELPSTLKTLEDGAFQLSGLTSITIPESVTEIGAGAFQKTKALQTATIAGNPTLGERVFAESRIQSIEMDQVTAISYQCFYASSLSSISMASVKSIGESAFKITNLTEFTVPDTVESIGPYFLDNIEDLATLTVSLATLQKPGIHENAFANISSGCNVVLTDVNTDITLLDDGFSVGDETYTFLNFSINTVQVPSDCTITNQTGEDVSIVVGGETITLANGSAKPVGSAASSDAYLEDLTVTADSSPLTLDPSFSNPVTGYTSSVGNDTTSVSVTACPSNSSSVVAINGEAANADNSYTVDVALDLGENPISIVVTAPDGTTQKTYTVTVTRKEAIPQHITISTADELMDFADKVNNGPYQDTDTADMLVELTADIDMSGYTWTPIDFTDDLLFFGTFDGNDYTISNLSITNAPENETYLGLFGATTATIRDVHVSGEFVDKTDGISNYWFGPIAGYTEGDVTGCTADFTVQGEDGNLRGQIIGGVVGYMYHAPDDAPLTMENCVSYTTISGTVSKAFVGGIAGVIANTETINCRNYGTISVSVGTGYVYAGGITGQTQTGAVLDHCVNNGDITQAGTGGTVSVGGICGRASTFTKITCCTNNGDLATNADDAGGILGTAYYGSAVEDCVIIGCLNTGSVFSSNRGAAVAGIGSTFGVDGKVDITANISLGKLSATGQNATVHPVTTNVSNHDGAVFSGNYYDESLSVQGTIPAVVTTGSTGMPLEELETEAFIQQINSEGGSFRLDEDGHIEVIPLSYTLTVVDSYADVSGAGAHEEGEQVSIDAGSRPGYHFTGWTSAGGGSFADASSAQTTFTMPDEAVTIYAHWSKNSSSVSGSLVIVERSDHGKVTVSPQRAEKGETVTITVKSDEGYELDTLTVTDKNGDTVKVSHKDDNKYTFTMPASSVTVTATFTQILSTLPFTDVSENAWYADAVRYVYEHGLMAGTSAATFGPEVTTSRSMIATILWRMAGSPVVNYAMNYTDVDPAAWYGEAVRWATSEGVVTGYGDGTFGTDDPITREQFAVMLWQFAKNQGYDVSVGENTNILSYTDISDLSQWAIPAMQWACGAGIISGTGNGSTLTPQGQATRAQAAVMLMQFCEAYMTW
jgi:uncharacterized repeat protein (TIGR02543 family)